MHTSAVHECGTGWNLSEVCTNAGIHAHFIGGKIEEGMWQWLGGCGGNGVRGQREADRLRLTMITPEKTRTEARTFCQVRVSMPIMMLITVAMIGWT